MSRVKRGVTARRRHKKRTLDLTCLEDGLNGELDLSRVRRRPLECNGTVRDDPGMVGKHDPIRDATANRHDERGLGAGRTVVRGDPLCWTTDGIGIPRHTCRGHPAKFGAPIAQPAPAISDRETQRGAQ